MASLIKVITIKMALEISSVCKELTLSIAKRKEELLEELSKLSINSKSLNFQVDTSFKEQCETFGSLCPTDLVDPDRCRVIGTGTQSAIVDEASHLDIHLKDSDGASCYDNVSLISIRLVHRVTNRSTVGEKVRERGDIVTYRYIPLEPGKHHLHVKISDKDARGSPFLVIVSMPLRMRCIPELALEGFTNKLGGVAIGPHGEIAVVDTGGKGYKTIHVFNSQLKFMMSFGNWGYGEGECYYPIGIAFDNEGNILVTDTSNHRIHKYDRVGKLVKTVGGRGKGRLEFIRPTGIKVNRSGQVYVCDRDNNRVQILTSDLAYHKEFGGTGDSNTDLLFPWDLAFDDQGDVYVVDAGHVCIKRFTPYGEYRTRIGPLMNEHESLKSPQMICIDDYNYLFVTDYERHEVVVFDTKGTYHRCFGGYGGARGQFYQPRGIAKTTDGTIYVCDPGNKRLQIFH